jgi:hypothetical protein
MDIRSDMLSTRKSNNAMRSYNGHKGNVTINAVMDQIPQELQSILTGKQLGMVMSAVNSAYHNGRASLKGLDLIDDCVWLPWGGDAGQLVPIAALKSISIDQGPRKANGLDCRNYKMDYEEMY